MEMRKALHYLVAHDHQLRLIEKSPFCSTFLYFSLQIDFRVDIETSDLGFLGDGRCVDVIGVV